MSTNPAPESQSSQGITLRVWCSPRLDMGDFPWNWAIHNEGGTIEFGREKTEADARKEAEEARANWAQILTDQKLP